MVLVSLMHQFAGESRYLTPLLVSRNGELPDQLSRSNSLQSPIPEIGIEPRDKIYSALKLLTFRQEHVLVQFWTTQVFGKCEILTTMNQPFGLGVTDERLCLYRKYSERKSFIIDKNREEEDPSPLARVFRHGAPEWTSDVTNYNPKDFPSQDFAIRCNLHGYLALPVFDSTTRLRIGVLELLMSSKYTSFAYEVRQIHTALKAVDLTTPQAFDRLTSKVSQVQNKHWPSDLEKILNILKVMCDIHGLPLAQTWAVSPFSSMACQKQNLKKSCNSFDTRCLGREVCMSTSALPFHVQDLGMWPFRKACKEQHLNQSHSFIGRALLSRSSSFCRDVTKLSEEEYPLVRNASISKLTSCFAIFLYSAESKSEYVLEFFLPLNIKDERYVLNLMQTLKQNSNKGSGFELGDESYIKIRPSAGVSSLSLRRDPHSIQLLPIATTNTKVFDMASSESGSSVANVSKTLSANVLNIIPSTYNLHRDQVITGNISVVDNTTCFPHTSMQKTSDTFNCLKQRRKRKTDSLISETVGKHNEIPTGEAATSLKDKSVSWSTSKRFCHKDDITQWTFPKLHKKNSADVPHLGRSSKRRLSIYVVVLLLVMVKRWSCAKKCHCFSGKWWKCGKHLCIPCKSDPIYQAACLVVRLKRWRNKISIRNSMNKSDHADVRDESTSNPRFEVKQPLANVSDTRTVTVKATFNKDMIKFPFRTSLGLLELKNNVAQRIKLNTKKLRLKYKDEDDDMILIACDTDLRHLLRISGTIKLFILVTDD